MSKIFHSMARSRMHFPSSGHRTGKLHICSMPSKAPPTCWELTSTRNSVEQVTVSRLRDNLLCRTSFPTWTLTALAAYPSTSGWLLSQLALQERLLQQWSCKLTHGSSPFLLPFKASLPKKLSTWADRPYISPAQATSMLSIWHRCSWKAQFTLGHFLM